MTTPGVFGPSVATSRCSEDEKVTARTTEEVGPPSRLPFARTQFLGELKLADEAATDLAEESPDCTGPD